MEDNFKLEKYKSELLANNNSELEMFKATISAGTNALKVPLLINGASSIAILTFIGKLSDNHIDKISLFASSLFAFSLGVFFICISSGLVYFVQTFFQFNKIKTGIVFNILVITFVFLSYISFFYGCYNCYNIFSNLKI